MEDGLELYAEPHDPARAVVGFDECSKELRDRVAEPVAAAPRSRCERGLRIHPARTVNLFVIVEPSAGRRHLTVTERRATPDFAAQMKYLCDDLYPGAEVIRVVWDSLTTHTRGSLFASYPPN
jgi:hypothetical protein